jgi:hypothetical protein
MGRPELVNERLRPAQNFRIQRASASVVFSATVREAAADPNQSSRRESLLTLTEAPFLATVFISLLCWSVAYFSDAIKKAPTITYRLNNNGPYLNFSPTAPKMPVVEYEIKNLTRDQVFKDLSFYIHAKKGSLSDPKAIPIAPSKISARSPIAPQIQGSDASLAQYMLPEFHPEWRFKLQARLTDGAPEDTELLFDYTNRTLLGQERKTEVAPVRLVQASPETFIVENDFWIIAIIFLASLIGIIWYIFVRPQNR